MTVNTTTINGFIVLPDDTVREKSSVIFTMTGFDTDADDNATVVPIPREAPIAANGSIDIDLWPNPEGVRSTFYRVTFSIYNGNRPYLVDGGLIEVPVTGGPYDLNDLLPIAPPQGATVDEYIAQLQASVAAAEAAADRAEDAAAPADELVENIRVTRDAFAEIASVTSSDLDVGDYARIMSIGAVYQRAPDAATDEHLDYSGSGGVKWYVVQGACGYDVRAFGAVLDNSTDDADAINLALSTGGHVSFPSGVAYCGSNLTATSVLSLSGPSSGLAVIEFGNDAGIVFTAGTQSEYGQTAILRVMNIKFKSRTMSPNACIDGNWSGGTGGTALTVIAENVDISGVDGDTGFSYGWDLNNARNTSFINCRFLGDRSATTVAAEAAWRFTTDSSGVEHKFLHCSAFFSKKGWDFSGNGEGFYFDNCVGIALGDGIFVDPGVGAQPLITVANTHLNCWQSCLNFDDIVQNTVTGCLFYIGDTTKFTAAYKEHIRIKVSSSSTILSSIVKDNQFYRGSATGTVIGIRVMSGGGSEVISIGGNIFAALTTGIVLEADATGALIENTNRFLNVTTDVSVLSTVDNNTRFDAPPYSFSAVVTLTGAAVDEIDVAIPKGWFNATPSVVVVSQASGWAAFGDLSLGYVFGDANNSPTSIRIRISNGSALSGGVRLSIMAAT